MDEHAAWRQLLRFSGDVPDPRDPRGLRYSLPELLLVIIAGLLAGSQNAEDIAFFAEVQQDGCARFHRTSTACQRTTPSCGFSVG